MRTTCQTKQIEPKRARITQRTRLIRPFPDPPRKPPASLPAAPDTPAADIYGRPAWDRILKKSDTIKVRFKPSDRPEPRDIEVAVVTLLP